MTPGWGCVLGVVSKLGMLDKSLEDQKMPSRENGQMGPRDRSHSWAFVKRGDSGHSLVGLEWVYLLSEKQVGQM